MINMSDKVLTLTDIRRAVKPLAEKYHIGEVYLFGSYARNQASPSSDIDFLVFGGKDFKRVNVLTFGEDLREALDKDVDAYEICEINKGSDFYHTLMNERVKII